jgi:hypothetical protein
MQRKLQRRESRYQKRDELETLFHEKILKKHELCSNPIVDASRSNKIRIEVHSQHYPDSSFHVRGISFEWKSMHFKKLSAARQSYSNLS